MFLARKSYVKSVCISMKAYKFNEKDLFNKSLECVSGSAMPQYINLYMHISTYT